MELMLTGCFPRTIPELPRRGLGKEIPKNRRFSLSHCHSISSSSPSPSDANLSAAFAWPGEESPGHRLSICMSEEFRPISQAVKGGWALGWVDMMDMGSTSWIGGS